MITWSWCGGPVHFCRLRRWEFWLPFKMSWKGHLACDGKIPYCLWHEGRGNAESEGLYSEPGRPRNNVNSSWAIGLIYLEQRLLYISLWGETRLSILRERVGQIACHCAWTFHPSSPWISHQPSAMVCRLGASYGCIWKTGLSSPWSFHLSTHTPICFWHPNMLGSLVPWTPIPLSVWL